MKAIGLGTSQKPDTQAEPNFNEPLWINGRERQNDNPAKVKIVSTKKPEAYNSKIPQAYNAIKSEVYPAKKPEAYNENIQFATPITKDAQVW
jgi:hypothetical protein